MSKSDAQLMGELMEVFQHRLQIARKAFSEEDALFLVEASLDIELLGKPLEPERMARLEKLQRQWDVRMMRPVVSHSAGDGESL